MENSLLLQYESLPKSLQQQVEDFIGYLVMKHRVMANQQTEYKPEIIEAARRMERGEGVTTVTFEEFKQMLENG